MSWRDDIEVQSPGARRMIRRELRYYPHMADLEPASVINTLEEPTVSVHMPLSTWTLIAETMNDRERWHLHPTVRDAYEQYQIAKLLVETHRDE